MPVFLFGGEERLERRHGLAFEVGGGIGEVQHGQFALVGIAVGEVVRQRLFLALPLCVAFHFEILEPPCCQKSSEAIDKIVRFGYNKSAEGFRGRR